MRFRKGTKVEVLSYSKAPYGEWRSAEIISGNGHTYDVHYNCSSMTNEAMVEKVPKKSIRPSPPLVKCIDSWSADDVVEVNHAGCWKVAVVSRFLGDDVYLVRLVGSCKELRVHKFNIRARQCWQDNQWVMMRKVDFHLINLPMIFFFINKSVLTWIFSKLRVYLFGYCKLLSVLLF